MKFMMSKPCNHFEIERDHDIISRLSINIIIMLFSNSSIVIERRKLERASKKLRVVGREREDESER